LAASGAGSLCGHAATQAPSAAAPIANASLPRQRAKAVALSADRDHVDQGRFPALDDRHRARQRRAQILRIRDRSLRVDAEAFATVAKSISGSVSVVPMWALRTPRPCRAAIASRHMNSW